MQTLSTDESQLLRQKLNQDKEFLLCEVGKMSFLGGVPTNEPDFWSSRGKEWLEANMEGLRQLICRSDAVRAVADDKDLYPVAQAIWFAIAPMLGMSQPLAVVAALLAKRGVQTLCENIWSQHDEPKQS